MTKELDRRFRKVGRIKRSWGTDHKPTIRRMEEMMDGLMASGRLDVLRALRDKQYTPLEVYSYYRVNDLNGLPTAATLAPLKESMEKWIAKKECSDAHRRSLAQTSRPSSAVAGPSGFSGAGNTRSPRMVGARPHVLAAQLMSLGAMGLELVGQTSLLRGIQKVFALRSDEQVSGIDALPVVAGVADDTASRDGPVVQLPGIAMRGHVASRPEAPVAPGIEQPSPLPTPVRLRNAPPEPSGDALAGLGRSRSARVDTDRHGLDRHHAPLAALDSYVLPALRSKHPPDGRRLVVRDSNHGYPATARTQAQGLDVESVGRGRWAVGLNDCEATLVSHVDHNHASYVPISVCPSLGLTTQSAAELLAKCNTVSRNASWSTPKRSGL